MKVKLSISVSCSDGHELRAHRIVKMPCCHAGLVILNSTGHESQDTIECVSWDILDGVLCAELEPIDYSEANQGGYGDVCTFYYLAVRDFNDWTIEKP